MIEKFRLWLRRWLEVPEVPKIYLVSEEHAEVPDCALVHACDDIVERTTKAVRDHGATGY